MRYRIEIAYIQNWKIFWLQQCQLNGKIVIFQIVVVINTCPFPLLDLHTSQFYQPLVRTIDNVDTFSFPAVSSSLPLSLFLCLYYNILYSSMSWSSHLYSISKSSKPSSTQSRQLWFIRLMQFCVYTTMYRYTTQLWQASSVVRR